MAGIEGTHTGVDKSLPVSRDVRLLRDGLLELGDSLVGGYCDLKLQLAGALPPYSQYEAPLHGEQPIPLTLIEISGAEVDSEGAVSAMAE